MEIKIMQELKAVGVRDWLWWTVKLRRNEFSKYLELNRFRDPSVAGYSHKKCNASRNRAHEIQMALADIK